MLIFNFLLFVLGNALALLFLSSSSCFMNFFGCVEFLLRTVFLTATMKSSMCLTKAIFLCFHNTSCILLTPSFSPRNIQSVNITSGVQFLLHCHYFLVFFCLTSKVYFLSISHFLFISTSLLGCSSLFIVITF